MEEEEENGILIQSAMLPNFMGKFISLNTELKFKMILLGWKNGLKITIKFNERCKVHLGNKTQMHKCSIGILSLIIVMVKK